MGFNMYYSSREVIRMSIRIDYHILEKPDKSITTFRTIRLTNTENNSCLILHFTRRGFGKEWVQCRSAGGFEAAIHFSEYPMIPSDLKSREFHERIRTAGTDISVILSPSSSHGPDAGCYEVHVGSKELDDIIANITTWGFIAVYDLDKNPIRAITFIGKPDNNFPKGPEQWAERGKGNAQTAES
jgi:hypothetical protein